MPALCEINYISLKTDRFRSAVFPQSDSAILKEFKSLNGTKQLANPAMHIIKIDDPATGQTIGYAKWLIPEILGVPPHTCVLSEKGIAQVAAADSPLVHAPRPMNEGLFFAPRKLLGHARQKHTADRDLGTHPNSLVL